LPTRAGVAAGTLFTYFPNKQALLNELYLELKGEAYARVNAKFPGKGSLERRARHIWSSYLEWAIEFPEKRKVSVQLNVSDVITHDTREKTAAAGGAVRQTLSELDRRAARPAGRFRLCHHVGAAGSRDGVRRPATAPPQATHGTRLPGLLAGVALTSTPK
jgi:AcrR family transcriptional regulator